MALFILTSGVSVPFCRMCQRNPVPPQIFQLKVHAPPKDQYDFKHCSIHHFHASRQRIFKGRVIFAQVGNQGHMKQRCLLHVSSGAVGKEHKNMLLDDWTSELWVAFFLFSCNKSWTPGQICSLLLLCPVPVSPADGGVI